MERLDELKQKYEAALSVVKQKGVVLSHLHVQDDKLFMQGAAPNEDVKNDVWNAIKEADPSFGDLTCDLSVDSSLPQPAPDAPPVPEQKTYTVVAGDSLWKIAQSELGNGSLYPKIVEANPGTLQDENTVIHPGDVLIIPSV